MASPFASFRKNQRFWMAAAVLVAIIAFVVSPMIESLTGMGRNGQPGRGKNRLVASWNGGSLHEDQLRREVEHLVMANTFLRKLATDVMEKGGMPNVPLFDPDLSSVGISTDADAHARIIERKLLVAEAERIGIHFDDQSVKAFLQRFVDGKLNGNQIQKALFDATNGGMSMFDFNVVMREELAKNEVLRLGRAGMVYEMRRDSRLIGQPALTTPGKNWQNFLRFKRAAKIQAYPIHVNDFESQVAGKPSERELQEIYKEGKDIIASRFVSNIQPAFMRPQTANFEYLALDVEKIVTEQMALIPEDTLRAEYERRVQEKQFRVPIEKDKTDQEAVGTPTQEQPGNTTPETTTPVEPNTPPADSNTTTENTDAPKPPVLPDPKDNAFAPRRDSNIKLVSFQEEQPQGENKPKEQDQPQEEKPADAQPPTEPTEKPADAAPQDSKPSIELSEPAIKQPDSNQNPLLPGAGIADAVPMRTKTFEEVKDQIARDQAIGLAHKIVEERLSHIYGSMSIYQAEVRGYEEAVRDKAPNPKMPERLDLAKLGEPLGFEYGTTGLVNAETVTADPIGSSLVMRGQRMQPLPFAQLVSENSVLGQTFVPLNSIGFIGGNKRYIFWKTESVEATSPSFEGVRDQVVDVWKKQQAYKLAENKAREIADKVGSGSLKDSLTPDDQKSIVEPASFTWYNPMFARMESRVQVSTIDQLQPIDESFMEAVFASEPNKSTFASDAAKKIVYVIKVLEQSPSTEKLLEEFAATPMESVSIVTRQESDRALVPWFSNLQKKLGFRVDD